MLKKVLSSVGVIFSFFLFAACEVGLGEKVDVIAPVLEIGTPEDGSVIMNTFTMTGSAGDDSFVALININVTSTTTGATVANYTGGMDIFRSAWSCTVNNRHVAEDGTVSYDIPDGEYTFTVTATDKVGRQTSKSRMYKIDNTAPIVVIKRPDTDDSFGKTIRVTGDIADANTLSSLYFTAYKKNSEGILEKIDTVRHANISGVGLDLIIAKKYDNPSSESEKRLTELYNKLYDTRDAGQDTAKIYCVIEVADSAKEYGAPSSVAKSGGDGTYSESGFTPMGNLSSCYYIYDTIYNKIYSESADDSFKLTNADLVSVANGSYSKSDNVAEIKQYLSENSIKTENSGIESGLSADKISSFKLNPANSPYFEVSGYKFENEFSSISNESKITVSVSQGRDQISLKENTIRLVLKECDEHGSVAEGTEEIVLVESLDNIEKIEDAEERAKALAVREKAISFGDSIKIVTSIGKLNAKKYYVVSAEGCDLDGNEIENSDGNIYGFLVETVSKPPVITVISGPADLCVMNNYNFSFAGTVKHWTDSVYLSCAVTAANEKNPDEEEHSYAADVNLNGDEWSIEITDEKFADLLSNSLYLCSVSITAVDSDQNSSSVTRRIHVDTDKPSMSTLSVSPYYSIDTTTKIPTVNGKISLSANVTDNYELYETNYDIYYLSGETRQSIQAGRLTDFSIEIKDLNTVVANLPVYDLTAEFVIADKAGNTNTVTQAIHVDQETDRPGISFSNLEKGKDISELTAAVNLFDKGNNKILGTVTDDDNVYSIKFNARKLKDDGSWDDSVEFYSVSGLNTSSYTLSIPLQIKNGNTAETFAEGIYKIDYEVWDKDGNASNGAVSCTNGSDLYHIGVDYAAPSLSIYTESGDFKGKNKGFKIKGSVTEGNKTVTVKVEGDNEALTLPVAAPAGAGWELQSVTSEESGSLSDAEYYKKGNWEFKVTDADAGKYEFVYITDSGDSGRNLIFTATDKFAKSSSQEFSYIIDSMPPYIFVDSSISEPIYVGTTLNPYASFKGTAEDPGDILSSSGVAAVEYSVSDSAAFSSWTAAEGTLKWSANINFEELAKSYFDSNIDKNSYSTKIKFRAKDNSGLTGDTDSSAVAALRTIIVDRKAPVITAGAISGDVCLIDSTYYARGTFTLKVNVSDDNLDSIKCSDSSIAMPAISGTGGEYEISIPASTAGSKTYTFTAVDKAKQSTSLSVNVYVDKTAPVPSVELQDYYKFESSLYTVNGIVKIKGNASDNDKVLKTEIKIYKDGETEPVYVSSDSDIPEATMFSIEKNSYKDFTDNTEYSIVVNSTDRAGNTGSKTIRFKVDQETDKPVITFSNLENGKDISELTTGVNLFDKGNNKILGTVTDDDNIYSIKFSGRKLKDDGTWDDPFEFYSVDGLSTSSYELSIPLQTGTFAEGIYKIDYEIWDKDGDPSNYAVSRTSGSDIYNIGVDYAAPTITVSTASGQFKVENTNFKIKGSVTEGNKIVTIKAEGDAVELSLPVSDLASNGWTLQNDTSEDSASLSDAGYYKKGNWEFKVTDADSGKYDFIYIKNSGTAGNNVKFTVTDRFAKTNSQEFSYVVDSYDPYVSVDSSIAEYVYVGTSLNPYASFKGNAEDPGDSLNSSGIAAVEYSVSDSDTFTSWTTAEGTLKWSANINFEEIAKSYFAANPDKNSYAPKIKFRATDNAGRTGDKDSSSVEAIRNVIVDRKAPVITASGITGDAQLIDSTYYAKGNFTLKLNVSDDNLDSIKCSDSFIVMPAVSGTGGEYGISIPASTAGSKTYTFIAVDKAKQSTSLSVNVYVDKTAPVPVITSVTPTVDAIAESAGLQQVNGKIKVTGTATDDDKVAKTVLNYYVAESDGNYNATQTGSIEKTGDDALRFNFELDTTGLTDKRSLKLELVSYDRAGNATASGSITKEFYINQESDRPTLTFTNFNVEQGADDKHNVFGMGSDIIYGTVKDDDGIRKVRYLIKDSARNTKKDESIEVPAEQTLTTLSLTINVGSGALGSVGKGYSLSMWVYDVNCDATAIESGTASSSYNICEMKDKGFGVDNEAPSASVEKVNGVDYSSGKFLPAAFTVTGTAVDDVEVVSVKLDGDDTELWNASESKWTANITGQTETAAGELNTKKFIVKDYFGRTSSTEIKFQVDKTAPVFDLFAKDSTKPYMDGKNHLVISGGEKTFTDSGDSNYFVSKKDSDNPINWFIQNQITLKGSVTEVNLDTVKLMLNGSESGIQLNNSFSFSASFAEGENTFKIVAADKAGQTAELGQYTLYVDTTKPVVTHEIESAYQDLVLQKNKIIRIKTLNAEDSAANDAKFSGIYKLYLGTSSSLDSTNALETLNAENLKVQKTNYEFTVPAALKDGTYTLYARAQDIAGNLSDVVSVCSFTVDNSTPVVTVSSPVSGATVNKKITLTGNVQDANLADDSKPVLWVKNETDSGEWTKASTITGAESKNSYSNGSWSLELDTGKLSDEKNYKIAVVFTDKAENATDYTASAHTVKVSQDSDRPVITFSNVTLKAGMTASERIMIQNKQIIGSVSDDDGIIKSLKIKIGDADWSDNCYDSSSGMWSYEFSNDNDGEKNILFEVTDAKNETFTSSDAASYLSAPKLKSGNVTYETSSDATILYASIDLVDPAISKLIYKLSATELSDTVETLAAAVGTTTDTTPDGWSSINDLNSDVGGTKKYLYAFVKGKDSNGMDTIAVKFGGKTISSTGELKKIDTTSPGYIYGLYKVDLSEYSGGRQKVVFNVTVYDKAGREKEESKDIYIDNAVPVIGFQTTENTMFYGTSSNTVSGTASDDGAFTLKVGFSKDTSTEPTTWKDLPQASSWAFSFNGTENLTLSQFKYLNDYVNEAYSAGYTETVLEAPLYIWVYGVDALGNDGKDSAKKLPLKIMTQGDVPTVKVGYPTADSSVGGAVRIFGSTELGDLQASVTGVYVQIDPEYNGSSFNDDWETALKNVTNVYDARIETAAGITGIKATGTVSWNLTINSAKEFNKADNSNRRMALRIYAVSSTNKVSKDVIIPFTLDPGSPVFGNSKAMRLVQYSNNTAGTGDIVGSQLYKDNMYIKGKWWLTGSIEDDSGIESVTVDGVAIDSSYISDYDNGDGKPNKLLNYPVGSDSGVTKIEKKIVATEKGEDGKFTPFTIKLYTDNENPDFTCSTLNLTEINNVVQSDGFYKITGTIKEAVKDGLNQSGFSRIIMFMTDSSASCVIDSSISQGANGTDNRETVSASYTTDKYDGSELVKGDYDIYWRRVKATVNGDEIDISSLTLSDSKLHVGGICMVNKVMYRIKMMTVESSVVKKIYVDTEITKTSTSDMEVYFASALSIDNSKKESGKPSVYGADPNPIDQDDGDYIVDYYLDTTDEWAVAINSQNIKDGAIKINFVAFDKAGNYEQKQYNATVANNRPRIAGVKIGTDLNGNGSVDDSELRTTYSGLYATNGLHKKTGVVVNGQTAGGDKVFTLALPNNGSDEKTIYGTDAIMTLKGVSKVIPEIVGGNNGLSWTCSVDGGTKSSAKSLNDNHGGTEDVRSDSDTTINLGIADLLDLTAKDNKDDEVPSVFSFKIWDKTEGTTTGSDSNWAELKMRLRVSVRDGIAPVATIRPFWWSEAKDGKASAVYNSSALALGHIDLDRDLPSAEFKWNGETELTDLDPKVSGVIYLEGQARDNVLVNELYLSFGGLAKNEAYTFGNGYACFAKRNTDGDWESADSTNITLAKCGVEFVSAVDSQDAEEYNVVTWKVKIDTSKLDSKAATNVAIKVKAKDRGVPSVSGSSVTYTPKESAESVKQTGVKYNDDGTPKLTEGIPEFYDNDQEYDKNGNFVDSDGNVMFNANSTPYCKVDVVPYITGISTRLDDAYSAVTSVFNRSATGVYPVMRGEKEFKLYGFNLNGASTTVKFNGTNVGTVTAGNTSEYVTFTVPTNAKSGEIEVTVGSIGSLNNKNSETAAYNLEPNGINNNILTDNRSVYVWGMNDIITGTIRYPVFKVGKDTNQSLIASYDMGGTSTYLYKAGTSYTVGYSWTQWYDTNVAIDTSGNLFGLAQNGDSASINSVTPAQCSSLFFYPYVADDRNVFTYTRTTNWQGQSTYYDFKESYAFAWENTANGTTYNPNRIKNQKLVAVRGTNNTEIYSVYYDAIDAAIKFRAGTSTGKNSASANIANYSNGSNGSATGAQVIESGDNAGEYASVGIIPTGVTGAGTAVVCWNSGNSLKFKYNTSPLNSTTWQGEITIDDDYAGEYCNLAVDAAGGIHIAYYRAGNKLKYAYLPKYNATASEVSVCMVDSYLSVGENISIETSSKTIAYEDGVRYVPYISYYSSAIGMAKVAWPVKLDDAGHFTHGVSRDRFTGTWEVQALPTAITTKLLNYTIGVGEKSNGTTNSVMLGYGTKTGLQTALLY